MAIGAAPDGILNRRVQEDNVSWYRKRNLRLLYLLMLPTCLGVEISAGYSDTVTNGLQAVPTWDAFFNHPRSTRLGLLSAASPLGAICSLPLVPVVVDKLGRKRAIEFGSVFMIVGGVLQAASHNFTMFVIARCVLGFGFPFGVVAASSIIGELAYPKERAHMGSLYKTSWTLGAVMSAGVTLGTFAMTNDWGWRIPSLLQVISPLLQMIFIRFLPESPRWLISKGRGEEAYTILTKYHAEGDVNSDFVKLEYAEIEQTLDLEKRHAKGSWTQLLVAPSMRRRLLICSFLGVATQCSGNGLKASFLPGILDTIGVHDRRTQNLVNVALTCWNLVNGTALSLVVPNWKRRAAFLTCTIAFTVMFTGWTIASARYAETSSQAASWAAIAFIFLQIPAYNIGYSALPYPYLVELFPFHVRAKGITVFQWWVRAGAFFNLFINPIGVNSWGWKYYIIYCIFLLFEIVFVYLFFPETANRSLEELAFLFEGDQMRAKQRERIEEEGLESRPLISIDSDDANDNADLIDVESRE